MAVQPNYNYAAIYAQILDSVLKVKDPKQLYRTLTLIVQAPILPGFQRPKP